MSLSDTIKKLRELEKDAAKGPWDGTISQNFIRGGVYTDFYVAECKHEGSRNLIVAMRNHLEELLDAADKLRKWEEKEDRKFYMKISHDDFDDFFEELDKWKALALKFAGIVQYAGCGVYDCRHNTDPIEGHHPSCLKPKAVRLLEEENKDD